MEQLLAHLMGDYCLQNHQMANRKTGSWRWAAVHAAFYGLPFLLLVSGWEQWAAIVLSHALIDRYRLASWWVGFWGVGTNGWIMDRLRGRIEPVEDAPPFLAVWLVIIVDNTMHLAINYSALRWL